MLHTRPKRIKTRGLSPSPKENAMLKMAVDNNNSFEYAMVCNSVQDVAFQCWKTDVHTQTTSSGDTVKSANLQCQHLRQAEHGNRYILYTVVYGNTHQNCNVALDHEFLFAFCRKWHIRELSLFGSALRDDFNCASDYDFLVSFEVGVRLDIDGLLDMKAEMEHQFGRPVDLVEKEMLRNPWRKHEILTNREIIYAA